MKGTTMKFKRKGDAMDKTLASVLIVGLIILSIMFTHQSTVSVCQKDAIEAGVAKWTVNPTTGEKTFEYLKTFEFIERDIKQGEGE